MKLGRVLILLSLILLFGILAAVFWMRSRSTPAKPAAAGGKPAPNATQQVNTISVVIAAQPIKRGTLITKDMLAEVKLPADRVIVTQITNPKDAIGKRAVRDLPQGVFLTKGDVAEHLSVSSEGSLAALQIPPGSVAISIPMTRLTGVAYALRPGDHVAIIATFPFVDVDQQFQSVLPNKIGVVEAPGVTKERTTITAGITSSDVYLGYGTQDKELEVPLYVIPSEPQRPRLVTQMVIKDAAVLYVGEFPLTENKPTVQQTSSSVQGKTNGAKPTPTPPPPPPPQFGGQTPTKPDIVTLVVSPQEAVTLKYLLDRQVVLTLALRAANDNTNISTDAVTLSYILDKYGVVVPAKLPYDIEPRVDKVLPPDALYAPTPTPTH